MLSCVGQAGYLLNHIHRIVACSSTGPFRDIPGARLPVKLRVFAEANGLERPLRLRLLPAMHTVLRGFRRSETKVRARSWLQQPSLTTAVSVGTGFTGGGDGS